MISAANQLIAYVDRYLLQRDVSPEYAGQLHARARKLCEWAERELTVECWSDDLLNAFLKSLSGKVTPETIRGYRCNLLALWNGCYDDRLTNVAPGRIRRPKIAERVIDAWDHADIEKLLATAAAQRGRFKFGCRKSEWFTAFVRVGYTTALRLGDVLKLTWQDVGAGGEVTVVQNKTGKRHIVALSEADIAAVRAIDWQGPELLPWKQRQDSFYRHFKALRIEAGLSGSSKYLRRSGASYADMERPGDGSKLLGHSTPRLFSQNYECQKITRPAVIRPKPLPD